MNFEQTIVEFITPAFKRYHDKIAFTGLGQTLTYGDLDRLSSQFADYLQNHTGLIKGDRIAIQLPNLLQYPVALFGALKAGLIVVNTNPLYTPRECIHQFNDAGTKALLVSSLTVEALPQVLPHTSIQQVIITAPQELGPLLSAPFTVPGSAPDLSNTPAANLSVPSINFTDALNRGAEGQYQPPEKIAQTVAMLQYTGGTTGVSKGAQLSHQNIVANALQTIEAASEIFRDGLETTVCPLPLYHIYAFTVHCMAVLATGGHNILIANPRDLGALVAEIKPYAITGFVGLNTLFRALLQCPEFRALDLSSLRTTTSGGMALTTDTSEAWRALTGITIGEGYGLTETSPVVSINPPNAVQTGTVGLPVPHTEIKVVDSEDKSLAAGEIGELWVRGPQVMSGYWQKPEATEQALTEDGWFKTGDMAVIQEDGYLRIVDRKKDMIVVSGFNVYPNEIEDIACLHPGILECAAIGVADEDSGEAVKLFVVVTEDYDRASLDAHLRAELTAYKVPKFIELIEALPKTNVGKVLRKALR